MIEVSHLTKSYGSATAVNDISFKVEKGEILGFLGPNGAGKTTTMRILTGYLPATSGTARIAGYDVFEDSLAVRKRIGYLPETPPLYPDMTVRDYLTFVARIKGVESARLTERVGEAMRLTNLTERADQLIKQLSRGFKQRVGIAQAIVHNPDVVILDEPTVGLDPNQIRDVRKLIKGLAGEHTIILSTHILPEVEVTCDRVVIIDKGRISDIDTTQNLVAKHTGRPRVLIGVRGDVARVQAALQGLAGATNIEVAPAFDPADYDDDEAANREKMQRLASLNEGLVTAVIESDPDVDLRAQVAARVVGAGLDLLALNLDKATLEDVFTKITTEEKEEEASDQ